MEIKKEGKKWIVQENGINWQIKDFGTGMNEEKLKISYLYSSAKAT